MFKIILKFFAASEYAPDFTIISAGFDATRGDPAKEMLRQKMKPYNKKRLEIINYIYSASKKMN